MGASHPTNVINNKFLEDLEIGSVADWVVDRIGIEERRSVLNINYIKDTKNQDPREGAKIAEKTPLKMAVEASKIAFERSGIKPEQIGMIICNTCTPYSLIPTTGQELARELNLNIKSYEVYTACPAFSLHIDHINSFKEDALPDYILCVLTSTISQRVDYNNKSDSAIWGDGAAAYIVSKKDIGKLKIIDSNFNAKSTRCQAVTIDTFGHFNQDGRAVRDFSVRQTVKMIKDIEDKFDIDWNRDIFIGHQANGTMLKSIVNNRKIPDKNHWHNVRFIGNQAAAGSACVLSANWDNIENGQYIVVAVLGAGLSWGSIVFKAV